MSGRLKRAAFVGLVPVVIGCKAPDMPRPPVETQPVLVEFDGDRGRQLIDSVFWYTGVRPDSVIGRGGTLRLVLPPGTFGHGARMHPAGCSDRTPGMGAVHTLAAHAWASRDARITRDTIEIVFAESAVAVGGASMRGSTARSCSAGPAVIHIAVADLPPALSRR